MSFQPANVARSPVERRMVCSSEFIRYRNVATEVATTNDLTMPEDADIAVVGAGAAGLMAAISSRRANPACRVLVLESSKRIGAKILISGGGRCNITHYEVDETAFAGSSPAAIRKILRRFDVSNTIAFFRELGVDLKREDTGKLFPVTDRAQTIIDALLSAAHTAGVEIRTQRRVESVEKNGTGFRLAGDWSGVDA